MAEFDEAGKSSSNTLLVIAVIAAVVSFVVFLMTWSSFNVWQGLSFEPESGNVTVEIQTNLDILVSPSLINWSTGYVDTANSFVTANLSTVDGSTTGGVNFQSQSDGFNVENIGNSNATIDIATSKDAAAFIGGGVTAPLPEYQFSVTNCDSTTCVSEPGVKTTSDTLPSCGGAFTLGTLVDVNTTVPGTRVCDSFDSVPAGNAFRIDVRVVIPEDAPKVANSDTMVVTATAIP